MNGDKYFRDKLHNKVKNSLNGTLSQLKLSNESIGRNQDFSRSKSVNGFADQNQQSKRRFFAVENIRRNQYVENQNRDNISNTNDQKLLQIYLQKQDLLNENENLKEKYQLSQSQINTLELQKLELINFQNEQIKVLNSQHTFIDQQVVKEKLQQSEQKISLLNLLEDQNIFNENRIAELEDELLQIKQYKAQNQQNYQKSFVIQQEQEIYKCQQQIASLQKQIQDHEARYINLLTKKQESIIQPPISSEPMTQLVNMSIQTLTIQHREVDLNKITELEIYNQDIINENTSIVNKIQSLQTFIEDKDRQILLLQKQIQEFQPLQYFPQKNDIAIITEINLLSENIDNSIFQELDIISNSLINLQQDFEISLENSIITDDSLQYLDQQTIIQQTSFDFAVQVETQHTKTQTQTKFQFQMLNQIQLLENKIAEQKIIIQQQQHIEPKLIEQKAFLKKSSSFIHHKNVQKFTEIQQHVKTLEQHIYQLANQENLDEIIQNLLDNFNQLNDEINSLEDIGCQISKIHPVDYKDQQFIEFYVEKHIEPDNVCPDIQQLICVAQELIDGNQYDKILIKEIFDTIQDLFCSKQELTELCQQFNISYQENQEFTNAVKNFICSKYNKPMHQFMESIISQKILLKVNQQSKELYKEIALVYFQLLIQGIDEVNCIWDQLISL